MSRAYGNYNQISAWEAAVVAPVSGEKVMVRIAGKYETVMAMAVNEFTAKDNRESQCLCALAAPCCRPV